MRIRCSRMAWNTRGNSSDSSGLVWLLTRRKRIEPWRWYDWANAGAVMMLVAMVLGLVIRGYMPTP